MTSTGWDTQNAVHYSLPLGYDNEQEEAEIENDLDARAEEQFYNFIKEFSGEERHIYRDNLKANYNAKKFHLDVDLADLRTFNDKLCCHLLKYPSAMIPKFEAAAKLFASRIDGKSTVEDTHDIQILISSDMNPIPLRDLGSAHVSSLVKLSGIVISAATPVAKATQITVKCKDCGDVQVLGLKTGLGGRQIPRYCSRVADPAAEGKCSTDPYQIMTDKCLCVDQQTLKLQESYESIPSGEMPRFISLVADRTLVGKVVPGTHVTVVGIHSIQAQKKVKRGPSDQTVGLQTPYLRIVGLKVDTSGGRADVHFTGEEEERFAKLARDPDCFAKICSSIAPSIFGSADIKKAVACLLFGGSRKRLPDDMKLRGDINVLLLGDPGTAKSQFLKFVEKVAPVGVYTSGKGSSAAGLTASVIRDPSSSQFYLEGGAMVLADGGVVCIDEFDKMREQDRVAIHEAMEQQTISIAKAGITTILNTRTSVLAAANATGGRWDETKNLDDNIDFLPTILSRFDMIFLIKDEHIANKDMDIARHVMRVHLNADQKETVEGELSIEFLKKYITYTRHKFAPRLSPAASSKLADHFVNFRTKSRDSRSDGKKPAIPITIRQLEAIVRVSESLAKMRHASFATQDDVNEAIRLFENSTLDAASCGELMGVEGMGSGTDIDTFVKIEKQILKRFAVGSQVSEKRIVEECQKKNLEEYHIRKVIAAMVRRGDLQHRMQRRVLYRIK